MSSTRATPKSDGETILVVEDNALLGSLVRRILETQGFRVLVETNGRDAVEAAGPENGRIRLLLTDVGIPDMSGPALAEILRQRDAALKVLYMSGHPEDTLAERGSLPAGADFIHKPFTPEDLTAKVREILARS